VQDLYAFLARRPWAGIGLALLVEAAILIALGRADPAAGVGIPAAVAAAIAGTVAVVFGPWNGGFVALVGAIVFVLVGDSGAGELAALGVWPAVVVAAGIFARRVSRERAAFRHIVAARELERQRLALELHDGTAQTLTAALLTLQRRRKRIRPALVLCSPSLRTRQTLEAIETGRRGELSQIASGASKRLVLRLQPGRYVLLCNLLGHYQAGQFAALRVR